MKIRLFDDDRIPYLYPFTYTRPAGAIRCGILFISEKWSHYLNGTVDYLTTDILQPVFPHLFDNPDIYINGRLLPNESLINTIIGLNENQSLYSGNTLLAFKYRGTFKNISEIQNLATNSIQYDGNLSILQNPWDIFSYNESELIADFQLVTKNRSSRLNFDNIQYTNIDNIFIENDAHIEHCIINATDGPVYIGKGAHIMDGAMLRGPLALCENAVVKMGAKIYGGTTIGTGCKVGGEIQNVVFFANSNKGHDGYLGNAVIGEWCNLGADTNCSNLKNDYGHVKVWCEAEQTTVNTGLQFCGLLMGDHSKSAINTMFNTGTIVGVSTNIFGATFPPQFIPSFSWGGSEKMITYRLKSGIDTANRMMGRRGRQLSTAEEMMMQHIFESTSYQRKK